MKKALLVAVVFLWGVVPVKAMVIDGRDLGEKIEGRVLLKFRDGVGRNEAIRQMGRIGRIKERLEALDVWSLSVPAATQEVWTKILAANPLVEFAEPDYVAKALEVPNDPNFADKQWGLNNTGQTILGVAGVVDADIDGPEAWDVASGAGVRVAVLDTGVDQDHEDISAKVVLDEDFSGSGSVDDFYGHGTHVAGIIAAATNNGLGVAGGCPQCVILDGKVLGNNGSGAYSWIANGITWAADNGARVINLSLGGTARSLTLERAVNYAWNKGAVIVAAAGNSGSSSKLYPAAYTKVIAVAATNNLDAKASWSNWGVKWVDVAAPGENIFSTFPNHPFVIGTNYGRAQNYDFASGTSMATPMTAAVAGMVWSSSWGTSNSAVRARIEGKADKISGTGTYWSAGRVNAATAVGP
ncbi:MAG: peptidase S8/S53 subtilisin kexin sedolisin [Microgenomates group bacterium Gr01-1014_16]|nr:MAG: peptidase S8/S53 subtilisin kexin sedolisin [Microgenomates group bacterium Gr01-1014_16]